MTSYVTQASSEGTSAIQIWTLVVALGAVLATIVSAVLLRKTGVGTVSAAKDAAASSARSAAAAELSSSVAKATLVQSAESVMDEWILGYHERRRDSCQQRLDGLLDIQCQLRTLREVTSDRAVESGRSHSVVATALVSSG